MLNRTQRSCRAAAIAAVIGLGTATGTVPLIVSPAVAAEQPASLIDASKNEQASIKIHKRQGVAETPESHNPGTKLQTPPGKPLETGQTATFTITKLQADLTTNAGFKAARELTVDSPAVDTSFGTNGVSEAKQATATNPTVTFGNLPLGVYKVEETAVEGGLVPAAPFLVFVPMTTGANHDSWNYDIEVYPKNSTVSVDKEVKDSEKNGNLKQAGSALDYTIKSDVPTGGSVTKYQIVDVIDGQAVESEDSIVVSTVTLPGGTVLRASDYDVVKAGPDGSPSKITTTITLKGTGLQKLNASLSGQTAPKVTAKINVTVKNDFAASELTNEAKLIARTDGSNSDTETPGSEVKTKFKNLKVLKHKEGAENEPLTGAQFQLHYCTGDSNNLAVDGDAITVGGENSWTTGDDGTIVIKGIHVTDFSDNAEVDNGSQKTYCLVETQAPDGYELLAKPVEVQLTSADYTGDNSVDIDDGAKAIYKKVPNVKSTQPELPLTGGKGIAAILAFGAAVMGAGFLYARRNTRRA
nr:SpaH/EbpB family LPXTG-anchored major pilin [Corynebacterium mendelii]